MLFLNKLRAIIRRFLKDIFVWYAQTYGYHVVDKKTLYDWQIHPNYSTRYNLETKIHEDAKDYLCRINTILKQLKDDY